VFRLLNIGRKLNWCLDC